MRAGCEILRLLWQATRGHRCRPWRSPYLRWRIETYSGIPADSVGARAFWSLLWRERWEFARYLRWAGVMRAARPRRPRPRRPLGGR